MYLSGSSEKQALKWDCRYKRLRGMSVREKKRVSSEGKLGEPSEFSTGLTLVKVRGKEGRLHRRVLD